MKKDKVILVILKTSASLREIMREKALHASLHPDPAITHLGDFIDILLDDIDTLILAVDPANVFSAIPHHPKTTD